MYGEARLIPDEGGDYKPSEILQEIMKKGLEASIDSDEYIEFTSRGMKNAERTVLKVSMVINS